VYSVSKVYTGDGDIGEQIKKGGNYINSAIFRDLVVGGTDMTREVLDRVSCKTIVTKLDWASRSRRAGGATNSSIYHIPSSLKLEVSMGS